MLFCEVYSGRYFLKDERELYKNLKDFHERSLKKEALTLNDYYRSIGIPDVLFGDMNICETKDFIDFEIYQTEDCCYINIIPITPKEEED